MKTLQILVLLASISCIALAEDYYYYYPPHKTPKPPKPTAPPTPTPPPPTPPTLTIQECHTYLGDLMDAEGNTLMTNTCEPFVENNEQKFKFIVSFLAPFQFNEECLDLQVLFETTELQEGNAPCDEWSYNSTTQEIVWNIKLNEFVEKYNCEWVSEDDQFTWICDFTVNIIFMDIVQQSYNAKIMVTVDRIYDGELSVQVDKNVVEGVCCKNEFNIETEIRFCTSLDCTAFLGSPLTVIRKETFYIEHRITTPGFGDLQQVSLGDFFPVIVDLVSEPGRLRLALRSNIAKPDLTLQVISLLSKGSRRFLQTTAIRDDYKLKGTSQMTIVRPEGDLITQEKLEDKIDQTVNGSKNKQQQKNLDSKSVESSEDDMVLGAIIAVSVLVSVIIGVSFCYIQRKNKMNSSSKYKESETKNDNQLQ